MWHNPKKQLAIIELENGQDAISFEQIKMVMIKCPSNVIYCEKKGKLEGIVSAGDIWRAYENKSENVFINKKFTSLHVGEEMRAKCIFYRKENINALPIVTEDNVLIGDYIRWDDLLYLKYVFATGGGYSDEEFDSQQHVALVKPSGIFKEKQQFFLQFKAYLQAHQITVECIEYEAIADCIKYVDFVLFVDENEYRAMDMFLGLTLDRQYHAIWGKLKTYTTYLDNIFDYDEKQTNTYLAYLYNQGISVLGLEFGLSDYSMRLNEAIEHKFASVGEKPSGKLHVSMYRDFFDDLYNEEYAKQMVSMRLTTENMSGCRKIADCEQRFVHVKNGERLTVGQPDTFKKSIYFFGPCYIFGSRVEDKNTIESYLQKHLKDEGYEIKVINCGVPGMETAGYYLPRIFSTSLRKGDIIIIDRPSAFVEGVQYLDLMAVLEKNSVSAAWMIDRPVHCNHKVNKLYAGAIYDVLKPILDEKTDEQGELVKTDDNFIKFLYLDRYFSDFSADKFEKIGAIVMNCNLFTYGHRHLIEEALNVVDFLIIFVVEEDKSMFSFAERFSFVREGTADLTNIKVVPSGQFILSQMSFPEYFIKETSEDIVKHTEQDITTFAECIAPLLGIKYRFVGEEPEDGVTNQYNLAMKKILPKYGIEVIEIPRKTINSDYISASSARKCLEDNNIAGLKKLVPKSTLKILLGEM